MKTALIAGASGLVGSFLVNKLLNSSQYDKVVSIGRRSLHIDHPKLTELQVDFNDLNNVKLDQVHDVFCCLGTTIKKAGSKENFRLVDFQYPINMANVAIEAGAKKFLLVSAIGADEKSRFFYNQVKGEVENVLGTIGFKRLDILRPSGLVGPRKEFRLGEVLGIQFLKLFGFLLTGSLRKYRSISAETVASAMLLLSEEDKTGHFVHQSDEIQNLVAS